MSKPHNYRAFPRTETWQVSHFSSTPFSDLSLLANFSELSDWLTSEQISDVLHTASKGMTFIEQIEDDRYYEQIIFQDLQVPTRSRNWHDFFNACIWGLFPDTKRALNHIHMAEIEQHGLSPRTPRRDRVTHFDECGVVLAYDDPEMANLLREHQWQAAFVQRRGDWLSGSQHVRSYVFGHANYEMLMKPHVGLTGKWLGVQVEKGFWQLSLAEQYQQLDARLLELANQPHSFTKKGELSPLPLLGIPGWWKENESEEFYLNTQYFRPKRVK